MTRLLALDYLVLLLRMAARNLVRNRRRSLLTASAACVGTLGILFTMAFMNGMTRGMLENATDWGLGHVQLRPRGYLETRRLGPVLAEPIAIRRILTRLAETKGSNGQSLGSLRFAGRFEREGLVRLGGRSLGVLLLGVEAEAESRIGAVAHSMKAGAFLPRDAESDRAYGIVSCVLGAAAARRLEIGVGDTVVLSLTNKSGDSTSVKARVRGLFSAPAVSLERGIVFMRRTDLARLFAADEGVVGYFVLEVQERAPVARFRPPFAGTDFGPQVEVLTWQQMEPMIPRAIELSDQFTWIAYVILMLGFALILFEAVMMSVYERTREIGVMRAIGSGPGLLFWMVEVESILISTSGYFAGLVLGGSLIVFLDWAGIPLDVFSDGMRLLGRAAIGEIHPHLRASDMVAAFSVALVAAALAAIYPALRAVRLTPVDAIHSR